jgi:hypothetical protein
MTTDPNRPFIGQDHTDEGERGKTEVKGIRFRDLCDCVVKGLFSAAEHESIDFDEKCKRVENNTITYTDMYGLRLAEMDPNALIQRISCEVEKAMGIYPNIPEEEN